MVVVGGVDDVAEAVDRAVAYIVALAVVVAAYTVAVVADVDAVVVLVASVAIGQPPWLPCPS